MRDRLVSNVARTDPAGKLAPARAEERRPGRRRDAAGAGARRPGPGPRHRGGPDRAGADQPAQPAHPARSRRRLASSFRWSRPTTERRVTGATVRFATVIEAGISGETRYVRVAQTGADGNATIPLHPGLDRADARLRGHGGSARRPRSWARSAWPTYSVGSAVTDAPRVGAVIALPRRVEARGRLLSAKRPAGGRWSGCGPPGRAICSSRSAAGTWPLPRPRPSATALVATGWLLDPGDYRLEYLPAAGAALPMLIEERVAVRRSPSTGRSPCPRRCWSRGGWWRPAGEPVADSEVRAFGTERRPATYSCRAWPPSGPDGALPAGPTATIVRAFCRPARLTRPGPPRRVSASDRPALRRSSAPPGAARLGRGRCGKRSQVTPSRRQVSLTSKSSEMESSGPTLHVLAARPPPPRALLPPARSSGPTGGSSRCSRWASSSWAAATCWSRSG